MGVKALAIFGLIVACAFAAHPASDSDHVGLAKKVVQDGIEANNKLRSSRKHLCSQEISETSKWIEEGNGLDRASRQGQRRGLADALKARIEGLKAFIAKLKEVRSKLGAHITRVNSVFQSKYEMGINDQANAAVILRELGMALSKPHSPAIKPIRLPAISSDGAPAAAAPAESVAPAETGAASAESSAEPAGTEESKSALLEEDMSAEKKKHKHHRAKHAHHHRFARHSQKKHQHRALQRIRRLSLLEEARSEVSNMAEMGRRVHAAARDCSGEGCAGGYVKTFELYRHAASGMARNKADFEKERVALAGFRDGLEALIKKKQAKLAALTAQLAGIEAALGRAEGAFADLWPKIAKHKDVITSSCRTADQEASASAALRTAVMEALGGAGATPAAPEPAAPAETGGAAPPAETGIGQIEAITDGQQ